MSSHTAVTVSRRKFLSFVSINAVLGSLSPFPVFALNNRLSAPGDFSLEFADRHGLGPELDAPDVERFCNALHEEKVLPVSSINQNELASVTEILKTQYRKVGLNWHDDYKVGFTYQHYGVADNSVFADQLLSYCKEVGDYISSRLTDVFDAPVSWNRLTDDSSLDTPKKFRGFVGRYTYYVTRAIVLNGENSDLPYLVQAWPLERAIHYIVAGASTAPKRGTLYIIPGTTSLVAPFSELLHLTFHEPSQRYARELVHEMDEQQAQEHARIAGETVTEAAAVVLASEFVQKLGHSERLPTINFMANNLSDRYGYLPKAIAYIKRHNVQTAMNTFVDSPSKFMDQIGGT